MNAKQKKTIKTAGYIAGGFITGAALLYVGYLTGTGFINPKFIKNYVGFDKSTVSGHMLDIMIKKPFIPGGKCIAYAFNEAEVKDISNVITKLVGG